MPDLPTRSQATIVSTIVAGIQGRASSLIDFGKGSPLLAITQGFTEAFLWFQALVLGVLNASRLSTSAGNDVDTFTSDFMPPIAGTNSPRLGKQAATGNLTFSRITAGASTCFIPVGATAQTTDATQGYVVTADATIGSYSASPPGYTMAAGQGSIIVPAAAATPGAAGNAQAGTITVITSVIIGIDAVINVGAFTGGFDQESDSALKKRFSDYILGLSRGDYFGLAASIEATNITVQWSLVESYNLDGSWRPGFFFVTADDGSGNPSDAFMQMITDAAYAVRPLGIQCSVQRGTIKAAAISLNIGAAAGFDKNVLIGLVENAILTNTDALGLGNSLDFYQVAAWAYSVAGVVNVANIQINGLTGDAASISATLATQDNLFQMPIYTIKCSSCVVS